MSANAIPSREESARHPDNKRIVNAFKFLEDVGRQVEALRRAIREQLASNANLSQSDLHIRNIEEDGGDGAESESGWIYRSAQDTFEVYRKKGKKPLFFGAIQVSLAPCKESAEEAFFPHVAAMLSHADDFDEENQGWENAEDIFQLDDEFLAERSEGNLEWIPDDRPEWRGMRWVDREITDCSAFVVPLIDLRDERDVTDRIIVPLTQEIERILRRRR